MITILDDTMCIVGILRKYEYSQYEFKAREIGKFTINAMLDKENLYLMDKTKNYYVLLDDDVFGIIESVKRESDSETSKVFTIKGSLALKLLEYRVIEGQVTFKGKSYKYIEELVKQNLIMSDDSNRNIALAVEFEDEERLKQICSTVDKQVTGGSLWDEISEIVEADKLRIILKPNIVVIDTEHPQNIDGWTLIIGAGEDRTRHRANNAVSTVMFSQSLSNIASTDYIVDRSKLRNTVYIAGEGEGTDRKWYNIDVNSDITFGERKGWNRKELWVDARDIQSEQDNKKLTDAEYEELMKQRADEKAKDNDLSEEYKATVTDITKQYTYKKDYHIGDFVTIADEELRMEIDAQITNVIVTRQDDREIIDLEFTYGSRIKDVIEKSETAIKKVEENNVNVKYIEANTKKLETGLDGVKNDVLSLKISKTDVVAKDIDHLPQENKSFFVNAHSNVPFPSGLTIPVYSKGVFVTNGGQDGVIIMIDVSNNLYIGFRNVEERYRIIERSDLLWQKSMVFLTQLKQVAEFMIEHTMQKILQTIFQSLSEMVFL